MSRRRDQRLYGLLITLAAVALLGTAIALLPPPQPQPIAAVTPAAVPAKTPTTARADTLPQDDAPVAAPAANPELDLRFGQAVAMLHARQYDYAVKALHRVLALAPKLPEAHVNMGYALLGLEQYQSAHDFFMTAIDLKPAQANAYYGLAEALEGMGDLEGALGAMRSFIHLTRADDPYLSRARAALWEWQQTLATRRAPQAAAGGENPG